jgi:hypothetical protein
MFCQSNTLCCYRWNTMTSVLKASIYIVTLDVILAIISGSSLSLFVTSAILYLSFISRNTLRYMVFARLYMFLFLIHFRPTCSWIYTFAILYSTAKVYSTRTKVGHTWCDTCNNFWLVTFTVRYFRYSIFIFYFAPLEQRCEKYIIVANTR